MMIRSKAFQAIWGVGLLLALLVFLGRVTQESWGISLPEVVQEKGPDAPPEKEKPPQPARAKVKDPAILAWVHLTPPRAMDFQIKVAVTIAPGECKAPGNLTVSFLNVAKKSLVDKQVAFSPEDRVQCLVLDISSPQMPESILVKGPGGYSREVLFADAKIIKPQEVSLTLPRELANGSQFDLRIAVRAVQSFTRTVGLAGSRIELELAKNERTWNLGTHDTGADGIFHQQIRLPEVEPGDYRLVVNVRHALERTTIERSVKITQDARILLTTDKPLYQPGQVIHMRSLVLSSFDLKPLAKASLEFEVEDGKSNKVFRKTVTTTEHGIAHADFVLASEVNQGDYRIRAQMQGKKSQKEVRVEPYMLPRFKLALKGDKSFYLPKETIKGTLQADYLFGKPVAQAKVKVSASASGGAERPFQSWEGKTDQQGLTTFEIVLPEGLASSPAAKGSAMVRLEAEVIDTADHAEKTQKAFPVSRTPLQITAIAEGGQLVPGVENRVYVAVITPEGKPVAKAEVSLRQTEVVAKARTNESGVALLVFTPKAADFQMSGDQYAPVETMDSARNVVRPYRPLTWSGQVVAEHSIWEMTEIEFKAHGPDWGHGLRLQTDRAVYLPGQKVRLQVQSGSPIPSAHIDLIREGQSILTDTLAMKAGKGEIALDLPADASGTLEVHVWYVQSSGELSRDGRLIYAQPSKEPQIRIETDRDTYRPGESAQLQFQLSDRFGKPAAGALGVMVVDEAVYQLQEIQPGLEKVFFTLREELLKPKAQVLKTSDDLTDLVRLRAISEEKQLVAGALFAAFQPKKPPVFQIDERAERIRGVASGVAMIERITVNAIALEENGFGKYLALERGSVRFSQELLANLVKEHRLSRGTLIDPLGGELTLEDLEEIDPGFTPRHVVEMATLVRMSRIESALLRRFGRMVAENDLSKINLEEMFKKETKSNSVFICRDLYGRLFRLENAKPGRGMAPHSYLNQWELVSAGPDGEFGNADDLRFVESIADASRYAELNRMGWQRGDVENGPYLYRPNYWDYRYRDYRPGRGTFFGFFGGAVPDGGFYRPRTPDRPVFGPMRPPLFGSPGEHSFVGGGVGGGALAVGDVEAAPEPIRLREYFPETLLWQPALITDDKGRATLNVPLADSITTWRLSASASTAAGGIGSAEKSLRVFQDFFVEPDLPRFLTQKDELTFSVALFNYLDQPQTIRLKLLDGDWFERLDGAAEREIELKPNQVLGAKYRIRALKNGTFPLEIEARGTKLSDRVRRQVEVLPYGQKIETASTRRLAGKWKETTSIPKDAVEGATSVQLKIYPGVFSQLVEGMDGILRMPGGCFEQTTSSAYPNLLVMQYIKRNGLVTPAIQTKAESYLNAGYQRLLTFERPGGGFDLWGRGDPELWLSAYGLMEFSDMAKVWPVDPAVIDRTKAWLLKQRASDGTWSNARKFPGRFIGEPADSRLVLTSYISWALLESGVRPAEIKSSLDYLRREVAQVESAYVLALAANALVKADSKDAIAAELLDKILTKLETMRERLPNSDAAVFPMRGGRSLTWARGNGLEVETTALAALALIESKTRSLAANQLLAYLAQSKDPHGTWGSTQATVLALKAMVSASTQREAKESADFKILVDGKEAAKGRIDPTNFDLLQAFDLKSFLTGSGEHEIKVESSRDTSMQVQIATRYYNPWKADAKPASQAFDLKVDYDRAQLAVGDTIKAKATLKYLGKEPTAMVMLDLGIAPGFQADAAEFAAMVEAGKLKKFSLSDRQAILYLEEISPDRDYTFEYRLKVKYPIKAKSLPAAAWEYYTPDRRVEARPTNFEVSAAVR